MRRVKRHSKTSLRRGTGNAAAPNADAGPSSSLRGRRLWLFRFLALTIVPLLLAGVAELGLRLARFGHSTAFFERTRINGVECLVENPHFGRRFFPAEMARSPAPVVMREPKPPGRYRIFLLGESAALGDPAPAFGVGRCLEVMLRERYPKSDFEVVCVAMTAINSHAVLPIARECAQHEGDVWVIYMGNNEMVGPFGAATVFGAKAPSLWQARAVLALKKWRLAQALIQLKARWRGDGDNPTWEGMKMFLENKVAPDDPKRETVYRNFRANLEDILRAGERAGVPIVLSTVAVNLRDFAPFAAMTTGTAGNSAPADLKSLVGKATAAQTAGDWPTAIPAYERALQAAPAHSDIEFRLGQCQLAMSNPVAARAYFSAARDHDALPFRADSRLNRIIEEVGAAHANRGVLLFDAPAAVAAESPAAIPGDERFYEHVHFNFDGNYRLARALAGVIAKQLPGRLTEGGKPEWATQERCEQQLGLTDWNRREVFENMRQRLSQPPFTGQPDNGLRLSRIRTRLSELRAQLTATNAAMAAQIYTRAIDSRPEDFRLYWNFAEFLEATRNFPGAIEMWRHVQTLIPHHHVGYYQLGRLLAEQGQREEARKQLNKALTLRPDLGAGWYELGVLSVAEGRYEEALPQLARARRLVPLDSGIPLQTAKALSRLKRPAEAIEQAREALRLDPESWRAHSFLGEELAFMERHAEARQELEAALRLNPKNPLAHLNLGVALFKLGQKTEAVGEFEEALRLDPQLGLARQYLEQLKKPLPPSQPGARPDPAGK